MTQKFSGKNKSVSIPFSILIGTVLAVMIGVIGAMIGATLLNGGNLDEMSYPAISIVVWLIASFSGTMLASKLAKRQCLLVAGLTAVCYLLILLGLTILFFDSQFDSVWKGILSVIAGTIPSVLLCTRIPSGKARKMKYRTK